MQRMPIELKIKLKLALRSTIHYNTRGKSMAFYRDFNVRKIAIRPLRLQNLTNKTFKFKIGVFFVTRKAPHRDDKDRHIQYHIRL